MGALDLAVVSLHVRLGVKGNFGKSGVSYFDADVLAKDTKLSKCPLKLASVPYVVSDSAQTSTAGPKVPSLKNDTTTTLTLSLGSTTTLSLVSVAVTILAKL